jgi:hypothetical protein
MLVYLPNFHTFPTISITLYISNSYLTTLKLYLYKKCPCHQIKNLRARVTCTQAQPPSFLFYHAT